SSSSSSISSSLDSEPPLKTPRKNKGMSLVWPAGDPNPHPHRRVRRPDRVAGGDGRNGRKQRQLRQPVEADANADRKVLEDHLHPAGAVPAEQVPASPELRRPA